MVVGWRMGVLVSAALLSPTVAAAKKAAPCAPGTFVLADADGLALSAAIGEPVGALILTGTELSLGRCAGPSRTRARRKATTIRAKLSACGAARKVKIHATVAAPACDRLRARVKAKRHRPIRLTGARTSSPTPLPPTTSELIAQALADGRIDYPTSLLYRMWAFNLDPQLPEEFDAPGLGSEDSALDTEIRRAWAALPPAVQSALGPYLVRPDDPASPYAAGAAPLAAVHPEASASPKQCPHYWTHLDAAVANVRVWDCSSGDPSVDAAFLGGIAALFDKHWPLMTFDMGPPVPDDGTGSGFAIDVYLLRGGECMPRGGGCKDLEPAAPDRPAPAARAVPAPPYTPRDGGEYASGYILLKRERAVAGGAQFESDVVHEFFHILQFAHTTETGSFFTEGSATWAEWVYVPAVSAAVHRWWTYVFMPYPTSLLEKDDYRYRYASYIWPFFVQQESVGPERVFAAWKSAHAAKAPADVETAVDAQLDFRTNFREFAVRNLNWTPPGNPLQKVFPDLDAQFPRLENTNLKLPKLPITAGLDRLEVSIDQLPSLTSRYRRHTVGDDVHHLVIDFETTRTDAFDADAIVKIGDTWRRVPKEKIGRRLEFCRDDPDERVTELVLVLTNHARDRAANGDPAFLTGNYYVTTNDACAAWSGSITYEETIIETRDETVPPFHSVYSNDSRRRQTWTIVSSGPVNLFGQTADGATLGWNGSLMQTQFSSDTDSGGCLQGAVLSTTTTKQGQGSGQRDVVISPVPDGTIVFSPTGTTPMSFDVQVTQTAEICQDTTATFSSTEQDYDNPLFLFVYPLAPSAVDPNVFEGMRTVLHQEEPRPGGAFVLDSKFTWSIRRRPQ